MGLRTVAGGVGVPRMESTRPRLGFVGAGWIGRSRLAAVANMTARWGQAHIAAVAEPSPEAAAAARKHAPEARFVRSLEALLDEDLDGVVIATPTSLHAEQCVAALERGLPVFCQKPLGRDVRETGRVVAAAARADRLLEVDLSHRFTSAVRRLRTVVESGRLGRVYAARVAFHDAHGPDQRWGQDARQSGGGCLIDLGTPLLDMALWVLGYPEVLGASGRLFAGGAPFRHDGRRVEDCAFARLDLATGAVVQLECSWRLPVGRDVLIEAAFYGTAGAVSLANVDGSAYDFEARWIRETRTEVLWTGSEDWGGRAIVDWVSRVAAGERFDAEAWRLVELARALDDVYGRRAGHREETDHVPSQDDDGPRRDPAMGGGTRRAAGHGETHGG